LSLRQYVRDSTWHNSSETYYSYDSQQNIVLELRKRWRDSKWENSKQNMFVYNSAGKLLSKTMKNWYDDKWKNSDRELYSYDQNGNLESESMETWDNDSWVEYNGYFRVTSVFEDSHLLYFGSKIYFTYWDSSSKQENSLNLLSYYMSQNYPNPFNAITNINYFLPKDGFVKIIVYDILGSEVASLINKQQLMGHHKVKFDASHLTSGVYFYRLQSGGFVDTKKLVLMR
jgi:hypothetical protein